VQLIGLYAVYNRECLYVSSYNLRLLRLPGPLICTFCYRAWLAQATVGSPLLQTTVDCNACSKLRRRCMILDVYSFLAC
jgi:hypothetical protein